MASRRLSHLSDEEFQAVIAERIVNDYGYAVVNKLVQHGITKPGSIVSIGEIVA